MLPQPCLRAIEIYSGFSPSDWPTVADIGLRSEWLKEKSAYFASFSPEDHVLMNKLLEKCARFHPEQFVRPGPKAPDLLKARLDRDPTEVLATYFAFTPLSSIVQEALSRILPGQRFGTDWLQGRWTVVAPAPKRTLGWLSGLAHELGHVYVNGEKREQSFRQMVLSEAAAMALEEKIVSDLLAGEALQEWRGYQRAIDAYNVFFFREESSLRAGAGDSLLDARFVFRESLWTSHGYQAVNAAASLIRLGALGVENADRF